MASFGVFAGRSYGLNRPGKESLSRGAAGVSMSDANQESKGMMKNKGRPLQLFNKIQQLLPLLVQVFLFFWCIYRYIYIYIYKWGCGQSIPGQKNL